MARTDVERLFLQAFMTRRIVSEDLIKVLWKTSKDIVKARQPNTFIEDDWQIFLRGIKESLDHLGMDIKIMQGEETGESIYALVNTNGDELAQLATSYTALEITFFKQIVEQIMTAPNESFSISSLEGLREAQSLPKGMKMGQLQAESLLRSFVSKGWLAKSMRNRYSLGARTLIELHAYITQTYEDEDLESCSICTEFVFKGYRCPGNQGRCKTKMHKPCFVRLAANPRTPCKCPTCAMPWAGKEDSLKIVGEGAVRDGQPTRRRKARNIAEGSDDEVEEEEGEAAPMSEDEQPAKKERKPRVPKGGRSSQAATQDDEEEEAQDSPQEEPEEDAAMGSEEEAPKTRRRSKR